MRRIALYLTISYVLLIFHLNQANASSVAQTSIITMDNQETLQEQKNQINTMDISNPKLLGKNELQIRESYVHHKNKRHHYNNTSHYNRKTYEIDWGYVLPNLILRISFNVLEILLK